MSPASRRSWLRLGGLGLPGRLGRPGAFAAITLAGALVLSACGGSTVTSDDLDENTDPVESSVAETDGQTDAETGDDAETESSATSEESETSGTEPAPQDQGAREISEIPPSESGASSDDQRFLESLSLRGIDVVNVESQLIGTAQTVCAGASATASAVAGQLVEQGRTDLPYEEVAELIESSARSAYCP